MKKPVDFHDIVWSEYVSYQALEVFLGTKDWRAVKFSEVLLGGTKLPFFFSGPSSTTYLITNMSSLYPLDL